MKICKYNYKYKCVDQRSDHQPRYKFAKTASCIINNHSHEKIIKRIPDLCHEKHGSDKRRRYFNDICKIDHGKSCYHSIDQILTQCSKSKRVLYSSRNLTLVNHTAFIVIIHSSISSFMPFLCTHFFTV